MKNEYKVTVKHYLNKELKKIRKGGGIIGNDFSTYQEEGIVYPLYVQITFLRKTTKIPSLINDNFKNLEEAKKEYLKEMKEEERVITEAIRREYNKLGKDFEMTNFVGKFKVFKLTLEEFFYKYYFLNEYHKRLLATRSEYMRMFYHTFTFLKKSDILNYSLLYFEKVLETLSYPEEFLTLKTRLEAVTTFYKSISKNDSGIITIYDWLFGEGKERFSINSLKNRISFELTSHLVVAIDEAISNIK